MALLSPSPAQCRPQMTMRFLPPWRPQTDAWWVGWGGLGCRSPSCSFLPSGFLGQLGASTLRSFMVKGLRWRWTDPVCCFREVLEGRCGRCEMGCAHQRRALLTSCVTGFSIYKMPIPSKCAEHRHRPKSQYSGDFQKI